MKTFRNLYIHLNGIDIGIFSEMLERQSKAPWIRRKDREEEVSGIEGGAICFEAKKGGSVSPALLFIFPHEDETLWVSNIIPTEESELTYDQYNLALEDFYKNVMRPAIAGTDLAVELTSDQISIGSVAGEKVEKAIIRFSNLANKSTGSSHPLDKKRWLEFLVLAHEAKYDLPVDMVIRTLVELGWSEEKAIELGIQFEFAQDLLSYVEER